MNILNKLASLIPVGHRDAIREIFETIKKNSDLPTDRAVEFEARRLARKIADAVAGKVSIATEVQPGERIDSALHNDIMENAYIDILSLYRETSHINSLQKQQTTSLQSDFLKSRAAILKLINDARVFSLRSNNPEYDDVKVIDFNIASNKSSLSPSCRVDSETRKLKLPDILKRRNHLRRRGVRTTSITKEIISNGQVGALSSQFTLYNMVDSKPESFWGEVIYSDIPEQNLYHRWSPDENGSLTNIINGPIVKVNVNFGSAEAVNQIKLLPFSNFNLKVLEITYRPSTSSKLRRVIPGFTVSDTLDWIEFNFETIFTTDIEVAFAQESYRTFNITVPKKVLYSTDFLNELYRTRLEEFSNNVPILNDIKVGGNSAIYDRANSDLSNLLESKTIQKLPTTEVDAAGKIILSIGESLVAFNPDLTDLLNEVSSYTNEQAGSIVEENISLQKLEYLIGCRELECNYVIYSPVGYYESDKLDPAATVANIEIEVDETHPVFRASYGEFRKSSIEWEVEFSEDRIIPIMPSNHKEGIFYKVRGEFVDFNANSYMGITRFPLSVNFLILKENERVLVDGVEYEYEIVSDGRAHITIYSSFFNRTNIYTVDYFASQSSASIDVLSIFKEKRLPVPDFFENTGPENNVNLSYYPFINYEIVNSDDFVFDGDYDSYKYIPPTPAYTTGLIEIHPNWLNNDGTIIQAITGHVTGFALSGVSGIPNWLNVPVDYFDEPYAYYLSLTDIPGANYKINSIPTTGSMILDTIPVIRTGAIGTLISEDLFYGNVTGQLSGLLTGYVTIPYSINATYTAGDRFFGMDNLLYEPITVYVGGSKAKNITAYNTLEQPAFVISSTDDGAYEYIHDGKTILFNQSIKNTEIKVDYHWVTKYVKLRGMMRTSKLISPTITPEVDEIRIYLNTTII